MCDCHYVHQTAESEVCEMAAYIEMHGPGAQWKRLQVAPYPWREQSVVSNHDKRDSSQDMNLGT